MAEVFRYEVIPSTSWAYLSSILIVSIYFKFNRFISIRNLDILLLVLLAPGLLIVQHGAKKRQRIEPHIRKLAHQLQTLENLTSSPDTISVNPARAELNPGNPNQNPDEQDRKAARSDPDATGRDTIKPNPVNPNPDKDTDQAEKLRNRIKPLQDELDRIRSLQFRGYLWLFVIIFLLMVRMLVDPFMVRRPLLEPNLEFSGLTFLTIVLLFFLIANVVTASVTREDIHAAESGKDLATAKATNTSSSKGPGYSLLFLFPVIPTFVADDAAADDAANKGVGQSTESRVNSMSSLVIVTKLMAVFGQLAIVIGIYLVGYLHFGNTRMGIGIVTLYLLTPYTAEMTGRINHILPAAAMVWAVVCYRRPVWSGTFLGLAMGLAYYPIFLLPLWISFYWHRGLRRFFIGFLAMVILLAIALVFTSADLKHFMDNLRMMFGLWAPLLEGLTGFWEKGNWDASFRIPVIAAFFCLSFSFAAWPVQKNLGTLLSCSAALMLGVQFWNGFGGGLLMAWFLPFALMTIFRPNLEDRTAMIISNGH